MPLSLVEQGRRQARNFKLPNHFGMPGRGRGRRPPVTTTSRRRGWDAMFGRTVADGLTAERLLNHETLWRYLRKLLDRLAHVLDEEVSDECVDIVVDLLGADRGFVL